MASLTIRGVSKHFVARQGDIHALQNIDLHVQEGEFVVLVGPSGCGKSTLLNIVAGLDRADGGEILEGTAPITGPGRSRSVIFQEGALFPWLTAQKNVEFGMKQMGIAPAERAKRAEEYLHLVHLHRFRENYLHELSGGMRQRVAIARALAIEPQALLMDEPFSALDAQTREGLYTVLQEIRERTHKTILFVTHNVREAACLADRVVVFAANPGRIKEIYDVHLARPRFVDDAGVNTMAQRIAKALREDMAQAQQKEYDEDWQPSEPGVLRDSDGLMGDSI
jgi:NitT/TauT family transport system ATP-binding protein